MPGVADHELKVVFVVDVGTDVGVAIVEILRVIAKPGDKVLINSPVYQKRDVTLTNTGENANLDVNSPVNKQYSADVVNGFVPAWFTLNMRTSYNFNSNVQLQASLDNIFDKHYRLFASGISAPGRNLSLTLRANF